MPPAECPILVQTFDERLVGVVPDRGAAVLVSETGAVESEDDFWRFQVLPNSPFAHQATPLLSSAGMYW
jgi:hypothetical protein